MLCFRSCVARLRYLDNYFYYYYYDDYYYHYYYCYYYHIGSSIATITTTTAAVGIFMYTCLLKPSAQTCRSRP